MQLDVALTWADLHQQDLSSAVVVVADVLRATTVMTIALANGARAIIPQSKDEDARRLYSEMWAQDLPVLLCGEKDGLMREGYDYGNSPLEFTSAVVADKTLIHLTTNGTRALVAASKARQTLIVSFANLSAVARYLRDIEGDVERIVGVVAGREGNYCLEDTVCLGGMLNVLLDDSERDYSLTDAARTAVDLYHVYRGRLQEMIRLCFHGSYLVEIGLGNDLPECVKLDTTEIVPLMENGRIAIR